jgi:hypothetical protein
MTVRTFWWIDDNAIRIKPLVIKGIEQPRHADLKHQHVRAKVIIKPIAGGNWSAVEKELISASQRQRLPDLIIIDQILGSTSSNLMQYGSSLAASLRAQNAGIPIVLVSAGPTKQTFFAQRRKEGIECFSLDDLESGWRVPDLYAICDGFASVVKAISHKTADVQSQADDAMRWKIVNLLRIPKEDQELFNHCIPREFIIVWDPETPHTFSRWVWNDFLARRGFLSDELGIATMLGLKCSGLHHLPKGLDACTYSACFASAARPRWWVSSVRRFIRKEAHGTLLDPLWKLGRKLVNRRQHHSKSYGHQAKGIPDCVAFTDDRLATEVAACQQDTIILPYDVPRPGFDPLRVFRKRTLS